MRRKNAALAAIVAAAIPLQKEIEATECKERPCASETLAKVPDQSHSHEEPPSYEGAKEIVYIGTSPMTSVQMGSKAYLDVLASNPELLFRMNESGNYSCMFPEELLDRSQYWKWK